MRRNRHATAITSQAEAFESLRNDYAAAKNSRYRRRRTGVASMGSGADYHYRSEADYLRIMEQARDMDRNDAVVGQIVDRAVYNTIQDGCQLDPQTGSDELDQLLWARWDEWSRDPELCDLAGEMSFCDIEATTLRSMIVDGDVFALPNESGALELVEGHRCRTPKGTRRNVVNGVLLDSTRKRQQYWFTKDDIDPLGQVSRVNEVTQYDARDKDGYRQVFQVYNPKRFSQTRGVSAFAPIFDPAGMFEDINFAAMVKQQTVSCFAVFREIDPNVTPYETPPVGSVSTEARDDGGVTVLQGIAPGMQITGQPGEKLSGFSPNVPSNEFFEHVRLILQLIGINLGMPLVMALMDASETNFSGYRGAVDQARMGFRRNQKALVRQLHTPVYKWKVRQWMADDPLIRSAAARGDQINVFGHRWNAPNWPYIEPLTDASADLLRVRNGLISPRRLHAERGRDWETVAEEIVLDNVYAMELALLAAGRLNDKFKPAVPISWREVLCLPTPDGVQVAIQPPKEPAPAKKPAGTAA